MKNRPAKGNKKKLVIGAGVGAAALLLAAYVVFSRPVSNGVVPNVSTSTPESSVTPITSAETRTNAPAPTSTLNPSATKASTAPVSSLPKPEGSFLSSPNVSLSSVNTTQESTCKTIPGATCTIVLKNSAGVVIAEIPVPEVDDSGGHLVYWDVKKYISQPGNYDVYAKATSGDKSSVSSTYKLGVQS